MLLDKKTEVLDTLDIIRRSYLKLIILKQLEQEAHEQSRYEALHELSENERIIVEDINGLMKYIVPDLLLLRDEELVQQRIAEIDYLQTSVIRKSLGLTDELRCRISRTKQKIDHLSLFPRANQSSPLPCIVNLRA